MYVISSRLIFSFFDCTVGKPIKLPKVQHPPRELVDKYHSIFVNELTELFEKYKVKYDSQGEKAILVIE